MKTLENAIVKKHVRIRPGIWCMWLEAPRICENARPGQFVHVRVNDSFRPLLRRPLSIGRVHENELELVWRVVGEGTRLLTEAAEGDIVNLLGPLGNPFHIDPDLEIAILVAGGLGLPPLLYLHETLIEKSVKSRLLLGVLNEDALPLASQDPLLPTILVTAEQGGAYLSGLVTEPASEILKEISSNGGLSRAAVYSCGPWGLVGALQRIVPREGLLRCEVSLEQQMGCGVGVCQGCAVHATGGTTPYRLVCHDGPVFPLFEVEVPDAG